MYLAETRQTARYLSPCTAPHSQKLILRRAVRSVSKDGGTLKRKRPILRDASKLAPQDEDGYVDPVTISGHSFSVSLRSAFDHGHMRRLVLRIEP